MNSARRSRLLCRALGALVALLACAGPALATGAVPRTPTLQRSQPVWVGFLLMFLMIAVTMAVSLLPSKRSHQD